MSNCKTKSASKNAACEWFWTNMHESMKKHQRHLLIRVSQLVGELGEKLLVQRRVCAWSAWQLDAERVDLTWELLRRETGATAAARANDGLDNGSSNKSRSRKNAA
jgi:hypothetical protein